MLFDVSYTTGKQSVDPTQQTPFIMWFWLSMSIWWVIRTYRRAANSRVNVWALAIGLPLIGWTAFASFRAGQSELYPDQARQLIQDVQAHAREVKRVKAELVDRRSRFTTLEELLTLEPLISEWSARIENIARLTQQVQHYPLPATVRQVVNLLRQALPTEQRQIANLQSQITVIRSAQGLSPIAREVVYREQLLPLMQQEQRIEQERQAAGLQDKIQQLATPR